MSLAERLIEEICEGTNDKEERKELAAYVDKATIELQKSAKDAESKGDKRKAKNLKRDEKSYKKISKLLTKRGNPTAILRAYSPMETSSRTKIYKVGSWLNKAR